MKKYSYNEIIQNIKKEVEKECKKQSNIYGYDIWEHHILKVTSLSRILARKLKADKEIVELSAFLHDIGAIKGDPENHHISGAKEAEKILKQFNYPQEKINEVKHCIYSHRASKKIERKTPEAKCVAAADAMSHFDEIGSLFSLVFSRQKMSVNEGVAWINNKLERDWQKMIPEAKEIMKDKYKAIKSILS